MPDFDELKRKQIALRRSIMNYGMGIIFCALGIFFLVRGQNADMDFNKRFPPTRVDILLGFMFIVYGIWRFYRGYRKNYFK